MNLKRSLPIAFAAVLVVAGGYWLLGPTVPNAMCADDDVREEVKRLIGSLTAVGKQLDAMLDPNWKPQQQPQPTGSNGYIAPAPKKIEKPNRSELAALRRGYVVLDGRSIAVSYDRDLGRVMCKVAYRLNNDLIADAEGKSEVYSSMVQIAKMQRGIAGLQALLQQDGAAIATYTVQPGDRYWTYAITVQPLGAGVF